MFCSRVAGRRYKASIEAVHDGGAEYTLKWDDGDSEQKRKPAKDVEAIEGAAKAGDDAPGGPVGGFDAAWATGHDHVTFSGGDGMVATLKPSSFQSGSRSRSYGDEDSDRDSDYDSDEDRSEEDSEEGCEGRHVLKASAPLVFVGSEYQGKDCHEAGLAFTDRATGWRCDVCGSGGSGRMRYRAVDGCDYDMCGECWDPRKKAFEEEESSKTGLRVFYFEVTINAPEDSGEPPEMAIGLARQSEIDMFQEEYEDLGSCAWHSNDGGVYLEEDMVEYLESYASGDTVGCGYSRASNSLVWTKNGSLLKRYPCDGVELDPCLFEPDEGPSAPTTLCLSVHS